MAARVDYNALKARTLGSGTDEEAVTVNTRALIDKVLARYSGEWTVLRELLQNAADAGATKVTIKFETYPSATVPLPQTGSASDVLKHVVTNHTVNRLLVTNDGQPFNDNDWSRLKRIAEGNPDETKIGAFGVGFYSVFADCEEPFISSGKEAMAFYWKGNSLFTRRLQLSVSDSSKDTSFVLDYRNTTSAVPPLLQVSQFLASSLTFVGIQNLELWLDDYNILTLSKKTAPSSAVEIPHDIETKTSDGLMKIKSVIQEVSQIDGSWMDIVGWRLPRSGASNFDSLRNNDQAPAMRNFFSRLTRASASKEDVSSRTAKSRDDTVEKSLTSRSSTVIFLNVNTATIETFTSRSFKDELERATKKPPPKTTKLAILTSPHIPEAHVNDSSSGKAASADVFASILPTRSGRIFIGFPTHQTTGLRAHISAPSVIPTVERESIDLNARWVRTWNMEMLRAAGIVCRIAFSSEMTTLNSDIQRSLAKSGKSKVRVDDIQASLPAAVNTARTFSFQESTPSAQTGQIIEDAFWTCNNKASIDVLSTCGVLPNHEVRITPKNLSFMEGIPALPEQLVSDAKTFVDRLIDYGLITEITVSDIKSALERSALSAQHVHEFLVWLGEQSKSGKLDKSTVKNLLSVAVANEEASDGKSSQVIVLGSMKAFLNPNKIPADLPVPSWTMPFRYTRHLSRADLEEYGWEELQIVPWLKWLLEEAGNRNTLSANQDLTQSPKFAAQVLPVLSKQWDVLSQSSKITITELLAPQTIIPTKYGMRKPGDAYFPSVKVFDDLPIVTGLNSVKDKILVALGVRKTLELGVVFSRLLSDAAQPGGAITNEKSEKQHIRLIQYLASVREDIPTTDIQRLRDTPICPKEVQQDPHRFSAERYKVSTLYEPRLALRELGLPILSWSGPYRSGSPEGKLLVVLGLRTTPSAGELIETMARAAKNGDGKLRDKAMAYFIANHYINNYGAYDFSQVTLPFLPLQSSGSLSTPSHCFTDEGAALLGFDVLKQGLQPHAAKFGVRTHPPMDECIAVLLRKPPTNKKEARTLFAYFSGRLSEINSANIPRLSQAKFVPIVTSKAQSEKPAAPRYVSPQTCFLGGSDNYGEIFDFVDFGQEANTFLLKCGSKQEPTKLEIAQILVNEPARISSTFRDPEKYLNLLRNLADALPALKKEKDLLKAMKRAPFLLASKDIVSTPIMTDRADEADDFDDEEAHGIKEWRLTSAADAIIVDDYPSYSLFRTDILAAPQETALEDFYYNLGSPLLSSLIEESATYGSQVHDQKSAVRLQKQICERSRLFLHDQPPDAIKHDSKWLEKSLKVISVSSIKLRRSLKGRNLHHVDRRSAAVTQSGRDYTLWISGSGIDYYQVSQSLVHLLLNRPKLHSALTLELLLKTELKELGARGFNVSRILRQKAAEKRLADQQQQLEEERRRIEDQEKAWNDSQQKQASEQAKEPGIPGGFPTESPQAKTGTQKLGEVENDEPIRRVPQGLFETWRNRLGLNEAPKPARPQSSSGGSIPNPNHQAITNGEEPPPPYAQENKPRQPKTLTANPVTAPHQMQQNLLSAIKKSRAYNSNALYSRGETNQIAETRSYCDEKMAQNLTFIASGAHGINIFLSTQQQQQLPPTDPSTFLTQHSAGLSAFASLLKEAASVFALDLASLNIFYDKGRSIAFNRQGSIFCNYLYFQQLHEERLVRGDGDRGDALLYWWVTLCHELAHNLVSDHSAEHSYYIEGFVMEYARRVVTKLGETAPGGKRVRGELLVEID
ncbi:hypothetical protein GJ744_008742 [Endocarpon pusillum]|uniref:Sacsin/Nov domain-containing protein n=1 Tax=Endocarpon pusillum TaxID=364733 RepID=A0A8H7E9Q2_9EURO|nr:hypothetical protein GJ744_008742 [Endocarpon pusillum]